MPFEIIMPKMGESVEEATITKWFVKENDVIEEDDVLLEIATDKVDSEIPSPVAGKVSKILFNEDDVVAVGKVIALIQLEGEDSNDEAPIQDDEKAEKTVPKEEKADTKTSEIQNSNKRFYSPLVKNIAAKEEITQKELDNLQGTGKDGRVTKHDILQYVENRSVSAPSNESPDVKPESKQKQADSHIPAIQKPSVSIGSQDEVVEMDRMRRLIADHMVMSKHVSPHVTNIIEADVTNLVLWRQKVKNDFLKREGTKLTYMPVFVEATAKALKDYPMVNSSVDGYKIIKRKDIHVGIAVALPTNNLIVPVIKHADRKNIAGLALDINDIADRARKNALKPDDIQGGTFTITNFGSFKNIIGTPIINQPQVAILATGAIVKKPAVIETPTGDVIAIRHKIYLSLTYDHRVVDGALGGTFLKAIADYLEGFDMDRKV